MVWWLGIASAAKQSVALPESKKDLCFLFSPSFGLNSIMKKKLAFVYILSNKNHTVTYVGVTSDLYKRMNQHKTRYFKESFTCRYNVTNLVYFEEFERIVDTIKREKQLKAGSREKKNKLISSFNPKWDDLCINSRQCS